jgi:hypothetical protein
MRVIRKNLRPTTPDTAAQVRIGTMPTLEEINDQRERLAIHRRNLAHLLRQEAKCSSDYVPLSIVNGITEQRGHIQRIKRILHLWGENVADHPDDQPPTFGL